MKKKNSVTPPKAGAEAAPDDARANSEIADFLADALAGAEEARGVAEEAWGEKDPRTEALLSLWCEVETQFREFHKRPDATMTRRKNRSGLPPAEAFAEGQKILKELQK